MCRSRLTTAFLIALWLMTPDVLCLLPGVELTMDEHECCERMGEQCGRMPMPEFHKCCQSVKQSDALIASKSTDYPELRTATLPAVTQDFDLVSEVSHPQHWLRLENASPPLIFPESFDILRI